MLYFMAPPNGQRVLREWRPQYPVQFCEEDRSTILERENFYRAKQLNDNLIRLKRSGPIWISVRSLWEALTATVEWPIRYLVFWIVLEALFGSSDGREVTYRLSQRLASFAAKDKSKRLEYSKMIRKSYDWRSKIVHGMRLSKNNRSEINLKRCPTGIKMWFQRY